MANEFILNSQDDMLAVASHVCDHFEGDKSPLKVVVTHLKGTGKWSMARLWRKWMSETASYMANRGSVMPLMTREDGSWYGSRPFNADDAHELFTSQWLGVDSSGNRLSWAKSGDNAADKGQRFIAMLRHQDWCVQKGIMLTMPRDSEFNDLLERQNS